MKVKNSTNIQLLTKESQNRLFLLYKKGEKKMDTSTLFKSFVIAIGEFTGYFLGGWDVLFVVLLLLIAIDYASGVIAAYISSELKSKVWGISGDWVNVGDMDGHQCWVCGRYVSIQA
ncbi:phage holin family protein [Ectobacillus polymachus]|uniref:phage holin family protein n=1 Tax=Ectobacillus polymachus TaxID=1508806 RepID=UPI003A89A158